MKFSLRRFSAPLMILASSAFLNGCLSVKSYVDPALPVVTKSQFSKVAAPKPVTVLFEFRTKGNANARVTELQRTRVIAAVNESGLFGSVSQTVGGADSGLLKVSIDNIGDPTGSPAAKGFGTGLTFGLAGSLVTDAYICTASYSANGQTFDTTIKHAIYSTIGNHAGPAGLTPMKIGDAANQAVDQMVLNALKDLDSKHAFQ